MICSKPSTWICWRCISWILDLFYIFLSWSIIIFVARVAKITWKTPRIPGIILESWPKSWPIIKSPFPWWTKNKPTGGFKRAFCQMAFWAMCLARWWLGQAESLPENRHFRHQKCIHGNGSRQYFLRVFHVFLGKWGDWFPKMLDHYPPWN